MDKVIWGQVNRLIEKAIGFKSKNGSSARPSAATLSGYQICKETFLETADCFLKFLEYSFNLDISEGTDVNIMLTKTSKGKSKRGQVWVVTRVRG